MIDIKIDAREIAGEFNLDPESTRSLLDRTIKEVAGLVANAWKKEAAQGLGSTRQQYMDAVVQVDVAPMVSAIELVGQLPNMLEEGATGWDMKQRLLQSTKAKLGKNGTKFITIPFSVGTPDALKENFSTIMPQEVYDVILKQDQNIPITGGVRTKGLSDDQLMAPFNIPQTKKVDIPNLKGSYTHKSSVYAGTVRQKSNVTSQNSYVSFRRISLNPEPGKGSDPLSWIHPGLKARKFAEAALERVNIPYEVGRIVDKILGGI